MFFQVAHRMQRGFRCRKSNCFVSQIGTHFGVPKVNAKPTRSNRLVARITPDDKVLLERAATLEGSSLASFVVSHVRTAAAEVIRQHETIQLNQAESERFLKALVAPPAKATARMARALELYRETVTER
jgi:uncharacterized protein (DUF1778 family)